MTETTLGRRNFLRKAAATGLAGVTGVVTTTGEASAYGQTIKVYGDSGWSFYYINVTGDIDLAGRAEGNDTDYGDLVHGNVHETGVDTYTYSGEVELVGISGDAHLYLPNSSSSTVRVYGDSGWSFYYINVAGDIDLAGRAEGNDTDYGDLVHGNVHESGVDSYTHTGEIELIGITGDAHMYV